MADGTGLPPLILSVSALAEFEANSASLFPSDPIPDPGAQVDTGSATATATTGSTTTTTTPCSGVLTTTTTTAAQSSTGTGNASAASPEISPSGNGADTSAENATTFAHFATWSEIKRETGVEALGTLSVGDVSPVLEHLARDANLVTNNTDADDTLASGGGAGVVVSVGANTSTVESESAFVVHEVPQNVACFGVSEAVPPPLGPVTQRLMPELAVKGNATTTATTTTTTAVTSTATATPTVATAPSPTVGPKSAAVVSKAESCSPPVPAAHTHDFFDEVYTRLMNTFAHFGPHRSRNNAPPHQKRSAEEHSHPAASSPIITTQTKPTASTSAAVTHHVAHTAFDPAMYSTPVDLSQSHVACTALLTLKSFARQIVEAQSATGSLSANSTMIPKAILDLASAAIIKTDGWVPTGSSESLDVAAAPFFELFDACSAMWPTELELMKAPLPWPVPSMVVEWAAWNRALGWLYEWCSQIDALLSHVRTALSEVPPHSHCWKWGKIELPCVHDVEPYPPFSTNIASSGVPPSREIAPPPSDGIFSKATVKIGQNSATPDMIAATKRYSCRVSHVLNRLRNQTSAAIGVQLISEECTRLKQMVAQLEDTLEMLPDHAHVMVHNGMNVQKVAFTMKTLFIGHGYMCKSKSAYLGTTSTRPPLVVEYKDIRQTIIHIHRFHRDHPYLPEHTHSIVLVPKDPSEKPVQYTSFLFLGGRRSVGHCVTPMPLPKPTY
ncbi:hypothetical protein Pelo_15716 [Pelomyxa schiedti]|nr:hypothetical protein Pelo_15716 [Pelomyxa schiedti]